MNGTPKDIDPAIDLREEDDEQALPELEPAEQPPGTLAAGRAAIARAVKHAPSRPGVYRMIDGRGDVLYVGKAKNIKKRITSYTRPTGHDTRIERVIALTAALPLLLALSGIAPAAAPSFATTTASPLELAELVAAALAMALLLRFIKFPASWMFGAMLASGLMHGMGLVEGGLPNWVRNVALIGIGALIGSRFARMRVKTLLRHVNAALGSFAIAIGISAIFVGVTLLLTQVRYADVLVAFAPGAMDAMLALALTLHIDPIFVGAHHLSRFVFVTIATPGIVHLFGRRQDDVDD